MAVARESSCFGGLKSACRGRRRRLDPFYSDSQVVWQGSAHWTRWWSLARSVSCRMQRIIFSELGEGIA